MDNMRPIDIDFEVHKRIELERTSFDESANEALRRLLGLGLAAPSSATAVTSEHTASGRSWAGKGVTLPHSTELKMEYNGSVYLGVIDDGAWLVDGARCKSPSDAAGTVAKTRDGRAPSLNGWIYWQVRRPTDKKWVPVSALRKR
jgi:hypothetical protein